VEAAHESPASAAVVVTRALAFGLSRTEILESPLRDISSMPRHRIADAVQRASHPCDEAKLSRSISGNLVERVTHFTSRPLILDSYAF